MSTQPPFDLKPLKITCTSSDCESNLHCFKFHKWKMTADEKGSCRICGIKLIDWKRVHKRALSDVNHTFKFLKFELFRHYYWHIEIDIKALNHARRKGIYGLEKASEVRVEKYIAPSKPFRDGMQTPRKGNTIFYAQHATATCCRKCIEYWHGIPQHIILTDEEIKYCVELIMKYIVERVPELSKEGEFIPAMISQ